MLKIKEQLHYKRCPTWGCCGDCNHFVKDFQVRSCGRGGEVIKEEGRCRIIGLEHGRMYRILPHFFCDKFNNSEYLKRLKRGSSFA